MKHATLIACCLLTVGLLAGCSSSGITTDRSIGNSTSAADGPTYESTPSTVPVPPSPTKPATNSRGNIENAIGEQGGASTKDGELLFNFVVTAITRGFKCPSKYSEPPQNGQFIAVSMTATAGPAVASMGGTLNISSYDFQIIGVDGVAESNVQSTSTYTCLDQAQQFPPQGVPQGTTANGVIVLDTKNASGFLVFRPAFMTDAGWEYKF